MVKPVNPAQDKILNVLLRTVRLYQTTTKIVHDSTQKHI